MNKMMEDRPWGSPCYTLNSPPSQTPKNDNFRWKLAADIHLLGVLIEDIQKALEPKTFINLVTKVSTYYYNHL